MMNDVLTVDLSVLLPVGLALILVIILIISFRSRAVVFCQYLHTMTGIQLRPKDVRRVFRERGRDGVRELFLDLIIREDLKGGPLVPPRVDQPKLKGSPTAEPET